ncbi:hypothetical protein NAP1_06205 [Erythrobacter sp. NAP1]|uniref:hypothetical protein n=1 Tax=Erythrobacter sp. NAP1 TaxID=237727 RepID=UPI0000686D3A|nr:hypothetical protein [Erythrobacter sp. NAP1]EAQ30347.1 hypothetical protein NAP1_06205 [Erythrobacter sp. NAP1]
MAQDQPKVMVQFHFDGDPPDPDAVAERFGIPRDAIDEDFGVIVTDEVEKLCTVLVPADVAEKMNEQLGRSTPDASPDEGSFSNPRIAPFGLPEDDCESGSD